MIFFKFLCLLFFISKENNNILPSFACFCYFLSWYILTLNYTYILVPKWGKEKYMKLWKNIIWNYFGKSIERVISKRCWRVCLFLTSVFFFFFLTHLGTINKPIIQSYFFSQKCCKIFGENQIAKRLYSQIIEETWNYFYYIYKAKKIFISPLLEI